MTARIGNDRNVAPTSRSAVARMSSSALLHHGVLKICTVKISETKGQETEELGVNRIAVIPEMKQTWTGRST